MRAKATLFRAANPVLRPGTDVPGSPNRFSSFFVCSVFRGLKPMARNIEPLKRFYARELTFPDRLIYFANFA